MGSFKEIPEKSCDKFYFTLLVWEWEGGRFLQTFNL